MKSAAQSLPQSDVFIGIRPMKPVSNLPPEAVRYRIRMRCNDFAEIFVRVPGGIRRFVVEDAGESFRINYDLEQGSNHAIAA